MWQWLDPKMDLETGDGEANTFFLQILREQ